MRNKQKRVNMRQSKRQDLVDTALHLFNERDFSVGIDTIIAESGVAKMTFYKYFPSKDDLILATLHEEVANRQQSIEKYIAKQVESQTAKKSDSHVSACLSALLGWHKEWISNPSFNGCLLQKARTCQPNNAPIEQILVDYQHWRQILIKGFWGKPIKPSISMQMNIIFDGYITHAKWRDNSNKDATFSTSLLLLDQLAKSK